MLQQDDDIHEEYSECAVTGIMCCNSMDCDFSASSCGYVGKRGVKGFSLDIDSSTEWSESLENNEDDARPGCLFEDFENPEYREFLFLRDTSRIEKKEGCSVGIEGDLGKLENLPKIISTKKFHI